MTPVPVIHLGRDIGQVAADAEQRVNGLLDACGQAAAGNRGWHSADELRKLVQGWQAQLDQLLTDTADAGQNLTKSAGSVAQLDHEIEQELGTVLVDMGGGRS